MSGPDLALVTLLRESSLGAAAAALAALWIAESVAPLFLGRNRRGSHLVANLGLAAINAALVATSVTLILQVTEAAFTHHFGLLNLAPLPSWLHWTVAILLLDGWQYAFHRVTHAVPLLWRLHAVHHSDAELDVSTGVRFHVGEIALASVARLAVLPLLGVTLPELLLYETLVLPVVLFHHANVRLSERADRRLRWLIVTPRMHIVHHSTWQPETDSNFSAVLSIWDRLFGTFRLRERPEEIRLGLDGWSETQWRRLPGMLAAPFTRPFPGAGPGRQVSPTDARPRRPT